MADLSKKIQAVLDTDENVKIASSKDFDVILGIPKWVVLAYLLYRHEKDGGKWKGGALPGRSVKLAKVLQELDPT